MARYGACPAVTAPGALWGLDSIFLYEAGIINYDSRLGGCLACISFRTVDGGVGAVMCLLHSLHVRILHLP